MIGYRRKLSRVEAFAGQGVSLRFPARSWSRVRADDGAVVIVLLWAPVIEGATEWINGGAEGLLARVAAQSPRKRCP